MSLYAISHFNQKPAQPGTKGWHVHGMATKTYAPLLYDFNQSFQQFVSDMSINCILLSFAAQFLPIILAFNDALWDC